MNIKEVIDVEPISKKDFTVGNIAYFIANWREPEYLYPVKILKVGREIIKTTAPPFEWRYIGFGRRSTLNFPMKKVSIYWDKDREREMAEYRSELLSKTTFPLDANGFSGVITPSIQHACCLARGLGAKSIFVKDKEYDTLTKKCIRDNIPKNARSLLVYYISKTPKKQNEIAEEMGIDKTVLTRYLYHRYDDFHWVWEDGKYLKEMDSIVEKYLKEKGEI